MFNSYFVFIALIVFLISTFSVRVFCSYAIRWGLIDTPNNRSLHQNTTPRGGGIVFVLLWLFTLVIYFWLQEKANNIVGLNEIVLDKEEMLLLFPSTLFVSLLGLWDDHHSLPARRRLMIQILIALFCVGVLGEVSKLQLFSTDAIYLGWAGSMLAILALIWSINLFNFMDGLDGIAGVEALSVLSVGGWLYWGVQPEIAKLIWLLMIAVAGFLVWNWPKARVFMGDAGSYCLGLLITLFAILGDCRYNIPVAYWVILYAVFWVDATITVIRRWIAGKHLATAHRDHAYQRLFKTGFSAQRILLWVIGLNSLLIGIVIWTRLQPQYLGLGLSIAVSLVLIAYLVVEKIQPMEKGKPLEENTSC